VYSRHGAITVIWAILDSTASSHPSEPPQTSLSWLGSLHSLPPTLVKADLGSFPHSRESHEDVKLMQHVFNHFISFSSPPLSGAQPKPRPTPLLQAKVQMLPVLHQLLHQALSQRPAVALMLQPHQALCQRPAAALMLQSVPAQLLLFPVCPLHAVAMLLPKNLNSVDLWFALPLNQHRNLSQLWLEHRRTGLLS